MRKKYIDLLREIALFYMFFQHAVLALLKYTENKGIILFLFELVPICPALFLFIAGFSINISLNRRKNNLNDNDFIIHLLKRGFILIILSSVLFLLEYGFQLPDLLISSGILNTIGLLIIIISLLIKLPYKKIFISIFVVILIVLTFLFEKNKIYIVPFNYGYEPIVPTITFGFIGYLMGLFFYQYKDDIKKEKIFVLLSGVLGFIIFLIFSIKYGIFKVFFSDIGRYIITRTFNESYFLTNVFSGSGNSEIMVSIWNYNAECFFASLGAVLILFSIMYYLEGYFTELLPENIFIPGRFAFFNYFYHLMIIAVLVLVTGFNNFSLIKFLLFLTLLFISSYIFSYLLLFIKKSRLFKK